MPRLTALLVAVLAGSACGDAGPSTGAGTTPDTGDVAPSPDAAVPDTGDTGLSGPGDGTTGPAEGDGADTLDDDPDDGQTDNTDALIAADPGAGEGADTAEDVGTDGGPVEADATPDVPKAVGCTFPADCLGLILPGPCEVIGCDTATSLCVLLTAEDGADCDDGDACTTNDTCDGGSCSGPPLPCSDTTLCTIDTCDPVVGCVHAPIDGPCDDGDACTGPDECVDGACVGAPMACDDALACTGDSCDDVLGCLHVPNTAGCDDGNACTVEDTCALGACSGAAKSCDDGDPCTSDSCDIVMGCQYATSMAPCDDGSACTEADTCVLGTCVGAPISCEDGDPCTQHGCDPVTGCTSGFADGAACSDGDFCSLADACTQGVCVGVPVAGCGLTFCGDGDCGGTEGCASCPLDCGLCECGDGACTPGEDCESCPADCAPCDCGDSVCTTGETCLSCPQDCLECVCGDGLCLFEESCALCPADCGPCPCGDGSCSGDEGEDCSSCPTDCGVCLPCGDGLCAPDESCAGCAADCGACVDCGDGFCVAGEDCTTCPNDCGACDGCGDGACAAGEDCLSCSEDCGGCAGCGDGLCQGLEDCLGCPQDCASPLPFGSCGKACAPADGPGSCEGNALCVPLAGGLVVLPADAPDSGVCLGQEPPCDPVTQIGCSAGETCALAVSPAFVGWATLCLGGTGGQPAGAPCIPSDGVNCKTGLLCHDGLCLESCDPIIPTCEGGTCADVGDLLGAGPTEVAGLCLETCGDGSCTAPETCETCGVDCGSCFCGDGVCAGSETCAGCAADCGACPCGDGICQGQETCGGCPSDCGPCECGDGVCQALEQCGTCPGDCGPCAVCGDALCGGVETCDSCPDDCGACPSVCELFAPATCGGDCDPTAPDPGCSANEVCVPSTPGGGVALAPILQGSGVCGDGCAEDGDCESQERCVGVEGLGTPGVCRATCELPDSPPCPPSQACVEAGDGASFCAPAGPCTPGSSSGCPVGAGACLELTDSAALGICLVGCAAGACSQGQCLLKTAPEWHQGTCVGQAQPCDPALQTGCSAGETCQVLGGPYYGGAAALCTQAAGAVPVGGDCQGGCGAGLVCWGGTCRATCQPPGACPTGPCEDVSSSLGQPPGTWGVCGI